GLLLLIDYIYRHLKKNGVSISANLAHSFVSKLRKRDSNTTITEPLCLLCVIGILRKKRPAIFAHIKTSAVYCLADPYRKKQISLRLLFRQSWRANVNLQRSAAKTGSIGSMLSANNCWQTWQQSAFHRRRGQLSQRDFWGKASTTSAPL